MYIKQDEFQAQCINNKYKDFGNHTGFQYRDRVYEHLIVGEWYDFKKSEHGGLELYINGKHNICTGHHFYASNEYTPECYNFYLFFSTVEAHRERKLNELINGKD